MSGPLFPPLASPDDREAIRLAGDALSYAWSVTARPSGSTATVTDATQAFAHFVPDVAGDYTFGLVVNDGALASAQTTVRWTVVASGSNRAPTADAGIDQNVPLGTVVTLDGSASSDPDGNPITYMWTLDSKPANSTAAIVDLIAPPLPPAPGTTGPACPCPKALLSRAWALSARCGFRPGCI